MSYLEELLPEFKKGAKIRRKDWRDGKYIKLSGVYAKDEYGDVYFIEPNEITADDWELYEEPMGREITKKRRLKLAEMEEKNKIWDELAKPEDFDALGIFFDEHDFSVADLLAIICARLSEFPEKVFTTEFMVNDHEFGIKIRRK